ncbi:protein FAM43B [Pristis pectinata]|uniref:protein FAM43B n=1 Tax=Pristis pectinata TaxID=685728 RepID=UPI00223E22D0|nr:protein FAM43B [Pristis pectinata]
MLPWRRSKAVLVEEEQENRRKAKAWPPYRSLLASLARACPGFWPDCPLRRLGGVFRCRRRKVQLSREQPSHSVRYLGNVVTLRSRGDGCTDDVVDKIWSRSEQGTVGARMQLSISPHGIRLCPADGHSGHLYLLRRITHCGADAQRPKVFAWVYRHQLRNKAVLLRCHAVRLSKAAKARDIALLLLRTSSSAFNDFKRLKRLEDARHRRQQRLGSLALPLVPLRRLLNSECPYRGWRGPPGLGVIAEDVAGEQEDGEADVGGISRRVGSCTLADEAPSPAACSNGSSPASN